MAIFSAILFSLGFLIYALQTFGGSSSPNFGSWIVWACISASNALICVLVMSGPEGLLIPFMDTTCILLFLGALWRSKKGSCELSAYDKLLLLMTFGGLVSAFFDPRFSTFILQIPLLLAVRPTVKGALLGEENYLVWTIWTLALVINFSGTRGGFENWIYPTTMFLLHAGVLGAIFYGVLARSVANVPRFGSSFRNVFRRHGV